MRIITSSSLQESTRILVLWYICEVSQGNETILIWALNSQIFALISFLTISGVTNCSDLEAIFPRVFFLKDLFDDYWMNVGLISAA